ncbi:MAG: DNA repair exonuclease [Deltaproteobacteria bacterium]|nr:DNA repair exonuclease [Deltaproteobacteria bacterium]
MFKFIHAADLHLDSPFTGVTAESPSIAGSLHSATFEVYNSLIDLCIEKQVQFLLIAGDIYDGADRSLRAQLRFRDGLQRLADNNIQSFVVHGNHDPFKGHSRSIDWPEGVHVFSYRKVKSIPFKLGNSPVAMISGISHENRNITINLAKKFEPQDLDLFQIGLLHCNVGRDTGHEAYAPCELQDLIKTGLDYWALGHVHERKILHKDPYVVYPGNTQGRNIREQKERGCYLVQVDDNNRVTSLEFHELDEIRWFWGSLAIDGLDTLDQLENALSGCIEDFSKKAGSRSHICRISLTGQGSLFDELSRENALQELLEHTRDSYEAKSPFVWVQDLIFECRPEIDLKKRREAKEFLGQVLRISQELSDTEEGHKRLVEEGLEELFKNRRASKHLQDITDNEISRMLKSAELLCFQMLEGDL